jgi:hypothetical protein
MTDRIKILFLAGCVSYALCANTASAEVIFQEDFASGSFSSAWHTFGSPSPTLTTTNAVSDFAMVSNGDGNWDSGIVTQDLFQIESGLSMRVTGFSAYNPDGGLQNLQLGFGTSPISAFDSTSGPLFGDNYPGRFVLCDKFSLIFKVPKCLF